MYIIYETVQKYTNWYAHESPLKIECTIREIKYKRTCMSKWIKKFEFLEKKDLILTFHSVVNEILKFSFCVENFGWLILWDYERTCG